MKNLFSIGIFAILLASSGGCFTSRIAVVTLDTAVRQAANRLRPLNENGGIQTCEIQVAVATGYEAGLTVPIPVVPVEVGASRGITTTITLTVDLNKIPTSAPAKGSPTAMANPNAVGFSDEVLELNTMTGQLTRRAAP